MQQNLDTLKNEIQDYLSSQKFNVFHGYSRAMDELPIVYWDYDHHPDYHDFLAVARAAEVKLIVYHQRQFSAENIDDALDRLETVVMQREEQRGIERRLNEMRAYEGFTCALELSFDFQGRIYLFDLRTEWFEELSDVLENIELLSGMEPDADEEGPISGYFSKN